LAVAYDKWRLISRARWCRKGQHGWPEKQRRSCQSCASPGSSRGCAKPTSAYMSIQSSNDCERVNDIFLIVVMYVRTLILIVFPRLLPPHHNSCGSQNMMKPLPANAGLLMNDSRTAEVDLTTFFGLSHPFLIWYETRYLRCVSVMLIVTVL
jgi:hypothetical protein